MKRIAAVMALIMAGSLAAQQTAQPPTLDPRPIVPRDVSDPVRARATRPPGGCRIENNNTGTLLAPGANGDALFNLLSDQKRCPQNALEFRDLVQAKGMTLRPAMVANRGFHNPLPQGSFSFFEAIVGAYEGQKLEPGDWFFGHFTAASIDNTALTSILSPQQAATPDNLLLETLVWDPAKQVFNFYEIRGNGEGGSGSIAATHWISSPTSRTWTVTSTHRNRSSWDRSTRMGTPRSRVSAARAAT